MKVTSISEYGWQQGQPYSEESGGKLKVGKVNSLILAVYSQ